MSSFALSDHERSVVEHFRNYGTDAEQRRAQIILLSEAGTSATAIAEVVKLSESQVYRWRREWRDSGLAIFPQDSATEPAGESLADESAPAEPLLPGVTEPRLALVLQKDVGMLPDDAMAEAGRKALYFHFERMLLNEPGSRLGEDIEAVHDMRVATRRMRSALRLFAPFFKTKALKPYRRELRKLAGLLGDVRDLDVIIEHARAFEAANPPADLSPLFTIWHKRREKARRALITYLDSAAFGKFVKDFNKFLSTPGKGAKSLPESDDPTAYQVRHIAPRLIYEHYEQVRAYETVLDGASLDMLHALRIDFKRLRYALEFFTDVLGSEAGPVIKVIKGMQDHLGDLNDARVASAVLHAFVDRYNNKYSGVPVFMRPDLSGVIAYAAARDTHREELFATFPDAWATFADDEVRRNLALAVAAL